MHTTDANPWVIAAIGVAGVVMAAIGIWDEVRRARAAKALERQQRDAIEDLVRESEQLTAWVEDPTRPA